MVDWAYVTHILLTLMEINWILKMIVFGSGPFTNDIINLKHQGVSETLKNADVICTIGIFERNEYIPHGNELVPYEITFMRIGNEFIPTLCWNLHKPKQSKIKTFLMEKVS